MSVVTNLAGKFAKYNFELAGYTMAQIGQILGICEVIQENDMDQNQQQHGHGKLKVHFLQQFSKYWIIHNVGQEITISYEDFQEVITKYAKQYNQKSEKLLKDFYESAHGIWNEVIKKSENTPTTQDIKKAILQIVAHTLDKDLQFQQLQKLQQIEPGQEENITKIDNSNENIDNSSQILKTRDEVKFGEQLFLIFQDFLENNLHVKEKSLVNMVQNQFDSSEHVKVCKEYCKFTKDFIQEFFPHNQNSNSKESKMKKRKLLRGLSNFIGNMYCKAFMVLLNRGENLIDLVFFFENSIKSDQVIQQVTFNPDFDQLDEKSKIQMDQEQFLTNKNTNNNKVEIKITQRQRQVLLQEQTIKNKIQIIALKIFLICQKLHKYSKKVTPMQFITQFKANCNAQQIQSLIFESKNFVVQKSFITLQKCQQGFLALVKVGKQTTKVFSEKLEKMPHLIIEHLKNLQKTYEKQGLRGILLYQQSLTALKMKKLNKTLENSESEISEKSGKEQIEKWEETQQPL